MLNKLGNYGIMRLNHLHPPFNNVDARKALLYLIDQEEFMKASFGNPKYYKKCPSNFACGTPMENEREHRLVQGGAEPQQGEGAVQEGGL